MRLILTLLAVASLCGCAQQDLANFTRGVLEGALIANQQHSQNIQDRIDILNAHRGYPESYYGHQNQPHYDSSQQSNQQQQMWEIQRQMEINNQNWKRLNENIYRSQFGLPPSIHR